MSLFRVSLALIVCAACTEPPQTGTTTAASWGDDDGGCGPVCGNARLLFGPFDELDMTGVTPSPLGGYRITKFRKDDVALTLTVAGFDVIGRAGNLKLMNDELVGAVFEIEQVGNPSRVDVTIEEVGATQYYEGGNIDEELLPTFKLSFQAFTALDEPIGPPQYVCPLGEYGIDDDLNRHALLFSGTRYSPGGAVTKTGAEAHPWFNVSCRDTAEWKAAEFRLVAVAETEDFPSAPNDYTTAVRSIRADYCGNGIPHTVLGTAVDWENRGDWLWKEDGLVLEAIWNETGAICKGTPRIAGGFDNVGCKIRTCTSRDKANWRADGYLMATWVPPPPPILIAP
jgi:hypothetical protein